MTKPVDRQAILHQLRNYQPLTTLEASYWMQVIALVERETFPWRRSTLAGHLTASAWIVNKTYTKALLVHHLKLDRWLQPGGHIEDDSSLLAASLREAREECGIAELTPLTLSIFDIDVHPIPANTKEPAHLHYDIRFAFVAGDGSLPRVSAESKDVQWFDLNEIVRWPTDPSLTRMIDKTKHWAHKLARP